MGKSRSRVTIRDVARAASVSVTTASDALNGTGRVEATTRARVQRAALELDYTANQAARALRSGRTGALGLLLPYGAERRQGSDLLSVDYYMELAASTVQHAFESQRVLVLVPALRTEPETLRFPVDGAIVVDPVADDPSTRMLESLAIPLVTVDRDAARPEDPWWVGADNASNTRRLLDHLIEAGARRVALLSGLTRWRWLEESEDAYARWASERGQEPMVMQLEHVADEAEAAAATTALLEGEAPPDAILALPERAATGALRAAGQHGLRVPGEPLIAACVDSHRAQSSDPPITALDLRPAAVAAAAVDLLIARIEGRNVPRPRVVDAALHARASTRSRP